MAKEFNCTYEAVRQQAIRYKKEIDSHSHLDGKTRYYDDLAVDFLRNHRNKNPIIVERQDTKEQLEQLRQENKALLIKVAEQADEYMQYIKETTLELQEVKAQLALAEKSQAELEAEKKATMTAHQQAITELKDQLEAEKERKLTWAERFRGRKRK